MGNRGPEPRSDTPSGAPVVLFVGDSFTEGYGVGDGDEFPLLVANRLKELNPYQPVRIINTGIGDTGTGRALRLIRGFTLKEAGPTLLVLEIMANDFDDNDRDGFFFINSSGVLIERNEPLKPSMLQELQPLFEKMPGFSQSHFFAATLEVLKAGLAKAPPAQEDEKVRHDRQRSLLLKLVNEILQLARGRGWSAAIMTIELNDQDNEMVQAVANQFGVKLLIVPSKVRRPDLYYAVDGHWNKAGHEYVATALSPIIEQELGLRNAKGH
jgi:lysophospholipase L1-like esterase